MFEEKFLFRFCFLISPAVNSHYLSDTFSAHLSWAGMLSRSWVGVWRVESSTGSLPTPGTRTGAIKGHSKFSVARTTAVCVSLCVCVF